MTKKKPPVERSQSTVDERAAVRINVPGAPIDVDEVLSAATRLAVDILKCETASVALIDGEGYYYIRSQYGLSPKFAAKWRARAVRSLKGRAYTLPDVLPKGSSVQSRLLLKEGIRSAICAPMSVGDEVIGALFFSDRTPRKFTKAELQVATLFAQHVSMSMQTANLYEKERSERRRLEALSEALHSMKGRRDSMRLRSVLVKLCRAVMKVSTADRCAILLAAKDTPEVEALVATGRGRRSWGWDKSQSGDATKFSFIKRADILKIEKPFAFRDVPSTKVIPDDWMKQVAIKSVIVCPLVHGGNAQGLLLVFTIHDFVDFPQAEIDAVGAMALQASAVIANANLYEREQRQRQRSEALAEVVTAAASTLSFSKVLTRVCDTVLKITVGDLVTIMLTDDVLGIRPVAAVRRERKEDGPQLLKQYLAPPEDEAQKPTARRFIKTIKERKKPIIVADPASSPLLSKWWVESFGLKGVVFYPLCVKDRTIGVVSVSTQREGVIFTREEVKTLSAVAQQAAVVIENARLYEREQQQRQRSEVLVEVLSAAASNLGLKQVLAKLCQAVVDLSVADRCSIFLADEQRQTLEPVMSAGIEDPTLWQRFKGTDITRESVAPDVLRLFDTAAQQGKPVIAEDAAAAAIVPKWLVELFNLKSVALYDLRQQDKSIGMMVVDSFQHPVHFPEEEIETLTAVAQQAATIIENARLYEQEQEQRRRSEALVEVMSAAASTLDMKKVLAKLCQAVVDLSVADRCSIFLADEQRQTLEPVMSLGIEDPTLWQRFQSADITPENAAPDVFRLFAAAAALEKPVIAEDAAAAPIVPKWLVEAFGLKSVAVYPLQHQDKSIGMMVVDSFRHPVHFPEEEIETLSAIARQAAIIIENARLYEQEQEQRRRSEVMVEVMSAAASTLSLSKVLARVCNTVLKITAGDDVTIMLTDDVFGIRPVAATSRERKETGQEQLRQYLAPPKDESKTPTARRFIKKLKGRKEPIIVTDPASSPLISKWWVESFGLKGVVFYPLYVKDRTIGVMSVSTQEEGVVFAREEVKTLSAVAQQAAIIIENARLYDQQQQQWKRAEALVEVLGAASSTVGLKKMLLNLCQVVLNLSVAERCSMFMVNENDRHLEPIVSLGPVDPALLEKFLTADDRGSAADRLYEVVTTWDEPVVVLDAASSPLIPPYWTEGFGIKSVVCYPLRIKDKTVGVITVDSYHHRVIFPQEEIDTLSAIAKQAAVMIENTRLREQLTEQAITDHVTGLFNHRHMHERLDEEFARTARTDTTFAVMMMDVDDFKLFNDTYGHVQGDEALRFCARTLRESLRTSDIVGRYGGDEFVAILPNTTREEAEQAGDRILDAFRSQPLSITNGSGEPKFLALSVGIACYPQDARTKHDLVSMADTALYEAKRMGGKRAFHVHPSQEEALPMRTLGFGLLQGLLSALAHRDPYTKRHSQSNVHYVELLAERMSLPEEGAESLRKAALLHDVGKIAIPEDMLQKAGLLDNDEWAMMQQHVRFGEMIVRGIAQIADAVEPVATHHERYDGTGYPRGLKGEEIPLLGRILAVIDVYSAVTLDRPYRKALSKKDAINELRKGAGTQFDPEIVETFLSVLQAEERQKRKKVA